MRRYDVYLKRFLKVTFSLILTSFLLLCFQNCSQPQSINQQNQASTKSESNPEQELEKMSPWTTGLSIATNEFSGITCGINNLADLDGNYAGLALVSGGSTKLDEINVTSCVDIDFSESGFIDLQITYKSVNEACNDTCEGSSCTPHATGQIFVSTDSNEWVHAGTLPTSLEPRTEVLSGLSKFRYTRVCRSGHGSNRGNLAIDFIRARAPSKLENEELVVESLECSIQTDKQIINPGERVTVLWHVERDEDVFIRPQIGTVRSHGSETVTLSRSTLFEVLSTSNPSLNCSVFVNVNEAPAPASVNEAPNLNSFLVTNNANDGEGSLRHAILAVNDSPSNNNQIIIDLEGNKRICPTSPLPIISRPVHIKGQRDQNNQYPTTELSGRCMQDRSSDGLVITAGDSIIENLSITHFNGNGIVLRNKGRNRIFGNHIGLDPTGRIKRGNRKSGVLITAQSHDNEIGGLGSHRRNIISGNGGGSNSEHGIKIQNSSRTKIYNNFIGTDITGRRAIGNSTNGIFTYQAGRTVIGGRGARFRNLISGNGTRRPRGTNQGYGITVAGNLSSSTIIQGNYIGTDITGNRALGNLRSGINLHNTANGLIGGPSHFLRNIISGNGRHGVNIDGSAPWCRADTPFGNRGFSRNNKVINNYIGTNAAGTRRIGNGTHGISLFKTQNATIQNNIVSGNGFSRTDTTNMTDGVSVLGDADGCPGIGFNGLNPRNFISIGVRLLGNKIGTDVTGVRRIPNAGSGLKIKDSLNTRIGNGQGANRNIIRYNGKHGVEIEGKYNKSTKILPGNLIQRNRRKNISR